jgi:aryl-alcohol dehydrogenase-like predicted oxidoreductase
MTGMRYGTLGDSGLMVSVVGLGCNNFGWRIDADGARAVVDAAIDAGVTLFDTSDTYGNKGGSEEILGALLQGRRDDVVLATKFGNDMAGANGADFGARGSRRYIRRAIEGSLLRLRTDHIDLYQYHTPDGITPPQETLAALTELVHEGKVRYIGCSNQAAWQVVENDWISRTGELARYVSAQNEYSLLNVRAEAELVPACEAHGIGLLPFFPLASGLLTGKYRRGETPTTGRLAAMQDRFAAADFDRLEALEAFARDAGRSLLDVAIGGLAARPAVASVIAGATTPEQVRANVAAGGWVPTADEAAALRRLTD